MQRKLIAVAWKWIPCQAVTSVLCLLFRPKTVHCSTKNTYTSEITFLALLPWFLWNYKYYLYCLLSNDKEYEWGMRDCELKLTHCERSSIKAPILTFFLIITLCSSLWLQLYIHVRYTTHLIVRKKAYCKQIRYCTISLQAEARQ